MVQKPDFAAWRKDAKAAFEDPTERERVLRDLDELERAINRGDREFYARIDPYKPASRTRLAVILVLCVLFVLVVGGVWLPQVLDTGVMSSSRYRPVSAGETPIEYWVTIGAVVVSLAGGALGAVFALFALVRYPHHPFRGAAAASVGLGSVPVDPLAEAEVYIAYGRREQAIQILEGALKDEPQRKDLADKLASLRRS